MAGNTHPVRRYYNGLIDSAVPLDNRALHVLKALHWRWICVACCNTAWIRPVLLRWTNWSRLLEYSGKNADKDFKRAFMPALKQVLSVYPAAKKLSRPKTTFIVPLLFQVQIRRICRFYFMNNLCLFSSYPVELHLLGCVEYFCRTIAWTMPLARCICLAGDPIYVSFNSTYNRSYNSPSTIFDLILRHGCNGGKIACSDW